MAGEHVRVYAGPTVSADDVLAALPSAQLRPPVGRGDLYAEKWAPQDAAVIIDGYYRDRLSVGHKEILWLMSQGVTVVGAASMGALRAAELERFGMRGVGTVFRMYSTGEIDGDDEVAVLHGPASIGYASSTAALVNIRYGCQAGATAHLISASAGERIVGAAKSLPFTHRTWDELQEALGQEVRSELGLLRERTSSGEWDLKRLDALSALASVKDGDLAEQNPTWRQEAALTAVAPSELLRWRTAREYAPGRRMSDFDVLNAARLFGADYPRLHDEVLTDHLRDAAASHGLTLDSYVAARLGTPDESPLPQNLAPWLTAAELERVTPAERLRLIAVRVWPVWQSIDWRPAVLARLRKSPEWDEWSNLVTHADDAAEETRYRLAVPPPMICGKVFLGRWQGPGTSPNIEMARRGFLDIEDLGRSATRFFAFDIQRRRAKQ